MSALSRLRTAIDHHGPTEMDFRYHDAVRECRRNIARDTREAWLRQQIELSEKKLIKLHSMKIFHKEEGWSLAYLKRQSFKEVSLLCELRGQLSRLLCGEA